MDLIPVKTRKLLPPKDDLFSVFDEYLPPLKEGDILLVTSKVVAIHQGRCVPKNVGVNKDDLIKQEAERYIGREQSPGHAILTLKHHTLIASAGIDESNANNHFILWPEKIVDSAKEIWSFLRNKYRLRNLGVVLTDSHTVPLRYGVIGVSIGHFGFYPTVDLRGRPDLFGYKFTMTKQDIPDALAALGVLLMGEADECTPILIIRGYCATFTDKDTSNDLYVRPEDDLYKPLLDVFSRSKSTQE